MLKAFNDINIYLRFSRQAGSSQIQYIFVKVNQNNYKFWDDSAV